jgi:hypothetical protein
MRDLFSFIKNKSKEKICHLVTNNRTEFKNRSLQSYYASKGIAHLTTTPYHLENNPFAERGNRTTVEKAQCILKDSGLGLSFWAEAVNCAVYLENLSPCKSIAFSSPSEMWFGKSPNLTYLHPFGCQAIYLLNRSAGKFRICGAVGIFVGYGEVHRLFRVLDEETGNVHITHHIKFNKHVFPAFQTSDVPDRDKEIDLLLISLSDSPTAPSSEPALSSSESPPPSTECQNSDNANHNDDSNRFQELDNQHPIPNSLESDNEAAEMLIPNNN